jgi:N-acetylmuramoyl-L-alanine amidase
VFALTPAGAPSTMSGDKDAAMTGNRNDRQNVYLAYQVQKALTSSYAAYDRGVQRARFVVLKDATMPAILVEGGFMSHPAEARRIYDPAYRKRMAKAIVDGILAYKRVTDPKTK